MARVATTRPPVAAYGCPAANEDPLTLSRLRSTLPNGASRPSRSRQKVGLSQAASVARTVAAKAAPAGVEHSIDRALAKAF